MPAGTKGSGPEVSHPPVCPCIGVSMLSISESIGHMDILKSGFFILGTFNVLLETLDIHFVNSWL